MDIANRLSDLIHGKIDNLVINADDLLELKRYLHNTPSEYLRRQIRRNSDLRNVFHLEIKDDVSEADLEEIRRVFQDESADRISVFVPGGAASIELENQLGQLLKNVIPNEWTVDHEKRLSETYTDVSSILYQLKMPASEKVSRTESHVPFSTDLIVAIRTSFPIDIPATHIAIGSQTFNQAMQDKEFCERFMPSTDSALVRGGILGNYLGLTVLSDALFDPGYKRLDPQCLALLQVTNGIVASSKALISLSGDV